MASVAECVFERRQHVAGLFTPVRVTSITTRLATAPRMQIARRFRTTLVGECSLAAGQAYLEGITPTPMRRQLPGEHRELIAVHHIRISSTQHCEPPDRVRW